MLILCVVLSVYHGDVNMAREKKARAKKATDLDAGLHTSNGRAADSIPAGKAQNTPQPQTAYATPVPRRCISAADVVPYDVEWLWPGFIPAGLLTLMVGETRAGKSTILAAVAAAVSAGREMSGRGGLVQRNVLLFSPEEDPATTLRPRLVAASAELNRVHFGDYGPDGKLLPRMSLPADTNKLRTLVMELRIAILIIDPITAYLAGGVDARDDQAVRGLLDQFTHIASSTGCTIILTRHYRKSREGSPLDWVGGSGAWTHFPRVVLALGFDPDNPKQRILSVPKNSLMRDVKSHRYEIEDYQGVGRWVGGRECDLTAEDLGLGNMTPADRDALADACAFLLDALQEGEQKADLINTRAEDAGISRGTLRRAKAKLMVTSHPTGSNSVREWVWRLPEQPPPG